LELLPQAPPIPPLLKNSNPALSHECPLFVVTSSKTRIQLTQSPRQPITLDQAKPLPHPDCSAIPSCFLDPNQSRALYDLNYKSQTPFRPLPRRLIKNSLVNRTFLFVFISFHSSSNYGFFFQFFKELHGILPLGSCRDSRHLTRKHLSLGPAQGFSFSCLPLYSPFSRPVSPRSVLSVGNPLAGGFPLFLTPACLPQPSCVRPVASRIRDVPPTLFFPPLPLIGIFFFAS